MPKMIKNALGQFVGRAPDPDNDWKHAPLVWQPIAEDAPVTRTAFRPVKTPTQLIRACQACGKEFDALERVPGNYKLAQSAKYCGQTCARRAAKQRERDKQRQGVVGGVVGIVCRQTLPTSTKTAGGWVKKITREDVE